MADEPKFQNWVKSSLSLCKVKDGLVKFANEKAESLKNSIQKDVEIICKAAAHTTCTKCTFKSIKRDNKGRYYMSCPNCNHWISIIQSHAKPNHKLEWSNSDPQKWYSESWEIVKVFMGYGCNDSRSAADIDCSNIMTMMLGCTYFHKFLSTTTILQEIKDIRNAIMHSGSLKLNDGDFKSYLTKMIELLEDPDYLKHERTCQEAVDTIKQLRGDTLNIKVSKQDEHDELAKMISGIQKEVLDLNKKKNMITTNVKQLSDEPDTFAESHRELKEDLNANMTNIATKQALCNNLLDTINMSELPDIKTRLQAITDQLDSMKDDTNYDIRRLQDKFEAMCLKQSQLEQRQIRTEADVHALQKTLRKEGVQGTYEERKLKLQRHLLGLYENDHSSISVYPLRPNLTKELETMYVRQEMVEKNPRGPKSPQPDINDRLEHTRDEKVTIKTLNDLFFKDEKLCKNIFVTGEAGVGKSTFCKYIVNLWLKSKTDENVKALSNLERSDVETMKQFPLLFYVQLRGVKLDTETDTFASLIKKQLNLDNDPEEFLKEENCLIICDSLDEIASGLPIRGFFNKSTKLITSRPWKLEALREEIEGKAIDRQIEIVCIDEDSAETLVVNMIPVLAQESASDCNKKYHSFFKEMKDKSLISFLRIPVLLIQILCLWYEDDLEVGESQSSIYKKLVHYQIMIFVKKSKNYAQLSTDNYTHLVCKSIKCPCTDFNDILLKVGKLAFNALVSENRQYELVFDHNTTQIHELCGNEVETCLKVGILSQHKLFGKLTEEPNKLMSFVHKTKQEFFAALYLSNKVHISDIKSVLNTAISNLDRMLELEKLLMFVSGLNPKMGREMADLLLKAADEDPRIQEYRQTAWGSHHSGLVSNIQTAILAASTECILNQHQQQFRLDDVRVDEDNMSRVLSCLPAGSLVSSIFIRGGYPNNYLPTDGVMSSK